MPPFSALPLTSASLPATLSPGRAQLDWDVGLVTWSLLHVLLPLAILPFIEGKTFKTTSPLLHGLRRLPSATSSSMYTPSLDPLYCLLLPVSFMRVFLLQIWVFLPPCVSTHLYLPLHYVFASVMSRCCFSAWPFPGGLLAWPRVSSLGFPSWQG